MEAKTKTTDAIELTTPVWIVTDPTQFSCVEDIYYATTLAGFMRQVRGGLSEPDRPTVHLSEAAAARDAGRRLELRDAQQEVRS